MRIPTTVIRLFGRIAILLLVLSAILTAVWFTAGRRWLDAYLVSISYEEHTFVIPPNAEDLPGVLLSASENGIDLCNRSQDLLQSVAVRINKTYITRVSTVAPNQCKHLSLEEFHGDTWKRIPADRGIDIEEIEALFTVERTYYSRRVNAKR